MIRNGVGRTTLSMDDGEEVSEDRVECPKCGNYNSSESRYCAYCKHEINPPSFLRASQNASLGIYFDKISRAESMILVFFCALIVIAVVVMLSGALPLEYSLPLMLGLILAACAVSAYLLKHHRNIDRPSENDDDEQGES